MKTMSTAERRKIMEETPTSIRSIRLRAYCEQRAEAYYKAQRTNSDLDWLKYHDLSHKFARLCHGSPYRAKKSK
jgi:hypothetical protein